MATLEPAAFIAQAKVDDALIKAEYDKSPDSYRAPEQVKIEYLQLNQAAFQSVATVSADELKAEYENESRSFQRPKSGVQAISC